MKPFATLVFIFLTCVGAYAVYRVYQAKGVPRTLDISTVGSFLKIPDTQCDLSNGLGTVRGTLYISHNLARFDIERTDKPAIVHIIVNYEGTEISPAIMDYYGERIKELYDRYSLTTVRYSSSGWAER